MSQSRPALEDLYQRINYTFNDESLIKLALSHRSFRANNNERLEFLGDSLLNFVIAESLYIKFESAKEGQLSRLRASLVSGESLASIAEEINLGKFLYLGDGEIKTGGAKRPSILADAVEALLGAIYLDSNLPTLKSRVLELFESRLESLSLKTKGKDPKTVLQERLQAQKKSLPQYSVVEITGEAHCQRFTVQCVVEGFNEPTLATASNRRSAEKMAAEMMISRLDSNSSFNMKGSSNE